MVLHAQQREDTVLLLRICFIILSLLFVVALPSALAASADLSVPTSVPEGVEVVIEFGSDDALATLALYRDNALVATNSPYTFATNVTSAGLITFRLEVRGTTNETREAVLEVTDTPVTMIVQNPVGSTFTQTTLPIQIETSLQVDFCYTSLQGNTNTLSSENGVVHTGQMELTDGIYTVDFKCKSGSTIITESRTFLIDSSAPKITASSPAFGAEIAEEQARITLTTDEIATCSYWETDADKTTASALSTVDKLVHQFTVTQEGLHTYAVQCADVHGNAKENLSAMHFSLNKPPSALIEIYRGDILLSDDEVLNAGLYEVHLTASERITNDPQLTFSYQNGGGGTVVLEQDDDHTWIGYLSLGVAARNDVASFSTSLVDTTQITGTKITQGKIFLVDTSAPDKVTDVRAVIETGVALPYVRLFWVDEEREQDVTYNIYRSTYERIGSQDYYANVDALVYDDLTVQEGQTYYYAVAAVDKANNVGPFSSVVTAVPITGTSPFADPKKTFATTDLALQIAKGILDLETAKSVLNEETDPSKVKIISQANLHRPIDTLKTFLLNDQKELDSLSSLSDEAFTARTEIIRDRLSQVNAAIVTNIDIVSSSTFTQPTDIRSQGFVFNALEELFTLPSASLSDSAAISSYRQTMEHLNQEATIDGSVLAAQIRYANREESSFTFMEKRVRLPVQQEMVSIVEVFPQSMIEKNITGQSVRWSGSPTLAPSNTMAVYSIDALQNEVSYSYSFPALVDLGASQSVRGILVPSLDDLLHQTIDGDAVNLVSGNAIAQTSFGSFSWMYVFGIFIIVGLLGYFFYIEGNPLPVSSQKNTGLSPDVATLTSSLTTAFAQALAKQNSSGLSPSRTSQSGQISRILPDTSLFQRKTTARSRSPFSRSVASNAAQSLTTEEKTAPFSSVCSDEQATKREFFASLQQTSRHLEPKVSAKEQETSVLLLEAHSFIDRAEYSSALRAYTALLKYPVSSLSAYDQAALTLLYHKLLTYQQASRVVRCAEQNDYALLQRNLEKLKQIAQHIPEAATPLAARTRETYQTYAKFANRLAIERSAL